ncbi:hypothetical protein GE061_020269 [Apolygus lucorum]|uniref:C2H2-type domain-containing protein n=1 Tax=Apolygus lucorum TaxID=248454 RepID=A0A8S9WPN1_APOLU|nr:hypothetical protein GE061_020269 [Apolygus lucorum]
MFQLCDSSYKKKNTLNYHLKFECGKPPQFTCPLCPYKAHRKGGYDERNVSSDRIHFCFGCSKSYKNKAWLTYHEKYECGKERGRKEILEDLMRVLSAVGDLGRPHVCLICSRRYKNRQHLIAHQKFECGKQPQFICPHCPYRAHRKGSLKTHMAENLHGTLVSYRNYACLGCSKSYKNAGSLMRHTKFECGKEPQFACSFCPYRAHRKSSLKTHTFCKHAELIDIRKLDW